MARDAGLAPLGCCRAGRGVLSSPEPVPGYDAAASRVEGQDTVCHRVGWGERSCVEPLASGACHLRFTLFQGSLFSYRWRPAC